MANKILWRLVILVGLFPFLIALFQGFSAATVALSAPLDLSVFLGKVIAYSTEHFLSYIMGILLVLIGIKHLKF